MTGVTPSCDGHHSRLSTVTTWPIEQESLSAGDAQSTLDRDSGRMLVPSPDGFGLVTNQRSSTVTASQATPTAFNTRSKFLSPRRFLPPMWLVSCMINLSIATPLLSLPESIPAYAPL